MATLSAARLLQVCPAGPLGAALAAGTRTVAVGTDRRIGLRLDGDTGEIPLQVGPDGAVVRGRLRFVRGAAAADQILIMATAPDGPTVAVLPRDRPRAGVHAQPAIASGGAPAEVHLGAVQLGSVR